MATLKERLKALASWGWKREGLPSWARFDKPYIHNLASGKKITIHQSKVSLGTTVWDSSIVLSKYFEKTDAFPASYFKTYPSAIELGAGCGLVGIVLSQLGVKEVVLTDMGATMDILRKNAQANAHDGVSLTTEELEWGKPSPALDGKKFDLIVATDTMYVPEAIPALILCLLSLAHDKTQIYFAYGRNSYAEADFYRHLKNVDFIAERIPPSELDEIYQSTEIKVIKIRKRRKNDKNVVSYEPEPEPELEPEEVPEEEATDAADADESVDAADEGDQEGKGQQEGEETKKKRKRKGKKDEPGVGQAEAEAKTKPGDENGGGRGDAMGGGDGMDLVDGDDDDDDDDDDDGQDEDYKHLTPLQKKTRKRQVRRQQLKAHRTFMASLTEDAVPAVVVVVGGGKKEKAEKQEEVQEGAKKRRGTERKATGVDEKETKLVPRQQQQQRKKEEGAGKRKGGVMKEEKGNPKSPANQTAGHTLATPVQVRNQRKRGAEQVTGGAELPALALSSPAPSSSSPASKSEGRRQPKSPRGQSPAKRQPSAEAKQAGLQKAGPPAKRQKAEQHKAGGTDKPSSATTKTTPVKPAAPAKSSATASVTAVKPTVGAKRKGAPTAGEEEKKTTPVKPATPAKRSATAATTAVKATVGAKRKGAPTAGEKEKKPRMGSAQRRRMRAMLDKERETGAKRDSAKTAQQTGSNRVGGAKRQKVSTGAADRQPAAEETKKLKEAADRKAREERGELLESELPVRAKIVF